MSPSLRWGPQPLLLLVLCWLLAHPVLGFPVGPRASATRDLAESASGDDLIVGSDFLSVFIGASLGNRAGRSRNYNTRSKVGDDPEQSILSFGSRTTHKTTLQPDHAQHSDEIEPHLEEISDSNIPSVEFVSLDSAEMNKNPLPNASTRPSSANEFQSESLKSVSRRYGPSRSDNSEYTSDTSLESPVDSKSTLSRTPALALPEITNEYTVVTDIVTSREEISSTEPLQEAESQDEHVRAVVEFNNSQHNDAIKESKPSQILSRNIQSPVSIPITPTPYVTTYPSQSYPVPSSTRTTVLSESTVQTVNSPIQQVVSVKVSSSVVQGPSAAPFLARPKNDNHIESGRTKHYHDGLENTPVAPASDEDMQSRIDSDPTASTNHPVETIPDSIPSTVLHQQEGPTSLVTEEQPAATAIQRSQFSVEEASPSSADVITNQQVPPLFQHKTVATVVETTRNTNFRPVSYHTSVSTATSDSRIHFYSDPYIRREPSSAAETVQTSVVASHRGSMQASYENMSGQPIVHDANAPIESRMGRYGEPHHEVRISGPTDRDITFSSNQQQQQQMNVEVGRSQKSISSSFHQEPVEKNFEVSERGYGRPERTYGQPERIYGVPEKNYEVDESVSVISNGRAHGIQTTTQSSVDPNQKITYVMDGGNYRKYRVEERTSDGFIIGEYGVVSHDDGSLRGVRYTADGTINPRLIQDALAKFLSL